MFSASKNPKSLFKPPPFAQAPCGYFWSLGLPRVGTSSQRDCPRQTSRGLSRRSRQASPTHRRAPLCRLSACRRCAWCSTNTGLAPPSTCLTTIARRRFSSSRTHWCAFWCRRSACRRHAWCPSRSSLAPRRTGLAPNARQRRLSYTKTDHSQ
jgi:hypothetical protein